MELLGIDMAATRSVMDDVAWAGREAVAHSAARPAVTFDELYRRDFHSLVALAYGLSGSRTGAEEIVQEAFLAAHRRWARISQYDDPSLWLRRVVLNRSVSAVRRRVAEARAMARLRAGPNRPHVLPEFHEELWRAMRRLPPRQAKAVVLHYVDDCSVAEVASILGCTDGTVKTHLHRARRTLADALGQHAPRRTHDD